MLRTAATTTDTVVTPTALDGVAQALRQVMCPANASAPARVSSAPDVKPVPGPLVRSTSPAALSATASHPLPVTRPEKRIDASTGTITTDDPVRKPDSPAEVCCRPVVWSRKPTPSSTPSTTARHRSVRDNALTRRVDTATSTSAAIPKRHTRNVAGASWSSEDLVTTNVDPQAAVARSNAPDAARRLGIAASGVATPQVCSVVPHRV